jgi:hypothetical protein
MAIEKTDPVCRHDARMFWLICIRSVSWHALKRRGSRQEAIATNQREPAWQLADRIKLKTDRKGPHGFFLFRQG